ncbi:hypothetical protein [Pseudothauera rhizosphaerae]|uniref:hypothetical protein n=1 Tax=Pseudothauera rhizosphaerae TaxID=2565932 RepID=UPI001B3B1D1A|nr:hypothetical protein [Pseudothauera rhizosphaerae]
MLTDAEVDQLIKDRGPEEAPKMSYAKLAERYGVSKSCVRDILSGRRRGGVTPQGHAEPVRVVEKVRATFMLSLPARAKIHRMGGAAWLERVVRLSNAEPCARGKTMRTTNGSNGARSDRDVSSGAHD